MYTWRKELRAAARAAAAEMPFAPVLLTGPTTTSAAATSSDPQFIEIETKGVRVRLPASVAPATVAAAIKALRSRS